ncbi:MAG: pyruvate, phosphate dikinase [Alphaproteobacteria bacterium]|nr:pyruvate, phosphate dikinase [Alphaproteobacteria bacterium]
MTKWVYGFGGGSAEGAAKMKDLLGGKGANLAEMANLGLPVPPGFTITTEVCTYYYANDRTYPASLKAEVEAALAAVGQKVGRKFGDPKNPLLVSVRSGGRASMPGMMDTVLNLGLNDETTRTVARETGNERFAYDSYRRFISMYGDVVLGVAHDHFEEILGHYKEENDLALDTDIDAAGWIKLVDLFKAKVEEELGKPFPQDPHVQLWGAIGAVFGSWQNARANTYRRLHNIPDSWGTAVNIQAMVFGNMGDDSATGVAFTRNPSTGEAALYGEFLVNAQGEDVVAGIRTPQPLTRREREAAGGKELSLEERMPKEFAEFLGYVHKLEAHYRDMQDIEFTVEKGRLWMLQTRNGKRTAKAALKIAVDLASEGKLTKEEAIKRIDPASLDQLLHPTLDPKAHRTVLATGLPASPGAATGEVVFDAGEAERLAGEGHDVILVRVETSPEDIHGMHAARGILTARGGMTSHAAVVARGMGRPCVSGAGGLRIDYAKQLFTATGQTVKKGEVVTIDGSTGQVMKGRVAMIQPELSGDFATLMGWADAVRRMKVRANAETPADAKHAREFGAEGIGLCRTEHMFFDDERIAEVRRMILADTKGGREAALAKLLPFQRADFVELFAIMAGLPVTIRLLDPPLHEFLPKEHEVEEAAATLGLEPRKLRERLDDLSEANPMLGHRGCRLGISFPEIYEMQARAMFEAAVIAEREAGRAVTLEVMIPLVAMKGELDFLKSRIDAVAKAVEKEKGAKLAYLVGTMIELPRAALKAGEIAQTAAFFSFGTNDLTQTTFGLSRDDATKFLPDYVSRALLPNDPFVTLDTEGVGELIRIAAERGRKTRPALKLGICGEHGGDPASIRFCESVKLDYVSCSPFRVPIARLAAAQAALD